MLCRVVKRQSLAFAGPEELQVDDHTMLKHSRDHSVVGLASPGSAHLLTAPYLGIRS